MPDIDFNPTHLKALRLQPAQRILQPMLSEEYGRMLMDMGDIRTIVDRERILAVVGALMLWEGRVQFWALLGELRGAELLHVTRTVRRLLGGYANIRRLEATATVDFPAGARWLRMLGFQQEGLMRAYDPFGNDVLMFSKVNHHVR